MGLTSVAAYHGLLRKTLSAQMKSIYGLIARLLQATGKVLDGQHDEEELPNMVLVESSTTVGPLSSLIKPC